MTDIRAQRVSIGFEGGQVLPARVTSEALEGLRDALKDGGWHALETEEGTVHLYLPQVCYLRVESDEQRVGFS